MYAFMPALTSHISSVHVPVNAIGKNNNSVFLCPKLSLKRICFGPAGTLVDKVKSGALVPTASDMNKCSVCDVDGKIQYRFGMQRVKGDRKSRFVKYLDR